MTEEDPTVRTVAIAVLDDYQDVARLYGPWDRLEGRAELRIFTEKIRPEDVVAALAPFEVVVAMRERTTFGREVLAGLPNLRLLVTTGPFNAAIDMAAADELGIAVAATGHELNSTVELTWALLLATARNVPAEDRRIRDGGWQKTVGRELWGRTLGLVGLGNIGQRMARIAQAFGMTVVAWSQNLSPEEAQRHGASAVTKRELFERSDVVSLHYKLSERSRHIIGARELAWMKPTALLINTSRGPLIDEPALIEALRDGTIGGAGLDVFDIEPLPADHPLRSLPHTVLTPHIGYVVDGQYELWYRDVVEDIEGWLRGEPVRLISAQPGTR
jgi:phosphoglycerate dehydrogenase-like enzyme